MYELIPHAYSARLTYLQRDIEIGLNGIEGLEDHEDLLYGGIVVFVYMTLQYVYYGLQRGETRKVNE